MFTPEEITTMQMERDHLDGLLDIEVDPELIDQILYRKFQIERQLFDHFFKKEN